jgi:ubiquinone/menaquinone biosynthesis C-methylase UbiE
MNNKDTYWVDFWNKYAKNSKEKDSHSQVLRTLNKKPIDSDLWGFTLDTIDASIEPNAKDTLLELCCGNGMISKHFSSKVDSIVSVDVSKDLIEKIDTKKYNNIDAFDADIRDLSFKNSSFDKVIIYAGIQYLTRQESIELLEKIFFWLKDGGILFIGDIPDSQKKWNFYNTPEREAVYFENAKKGIDIVGTWFDMQFFSKLTDFIGFSQSSHIVQNPELIYSSFRYDFKFIK